MAFKKKAAKHKRKQTKVERKRRKKEGLGKFMTGRKTRFY